MTYKDLQDLKIFNSKVTPFGGMHLIHEQLSAYGATDFMVFTHYTFQYMDVFAITNLD